MTKIKICGLRRRADIDIVNEYKPDFVGFVFCKSRRQVTKEEAKIFIDDLNQSIQTVGVFLNHPIEEVKEIASYCNLDILQFHGEEDPDYLKEFKMPLWKSFRVRDRNFLRVIQRYRCEGYLFDSYSPKGQGGTGEKFNWEDLRDIKTEGLFILAGGLHADNVEEGINTLQPDIVDISSGVEVEGYKDREKVRNFIKKVRDYEYRFNEDR